MPNLLSTYVALGAIAILAAPIFVAPAHSADDSYTLLVARVESARFIEDASFIEPGSGHPVVRDRYRVKLRDIHVIEGNYVSRGSLSVDMFASGIFKPARFPKVREIFVVLRSDQSGRPVVEDWGRVQHMVCINDYALQLYGLGKSFTSDYRQTFGGGADCAKLE